VLAYRSYVDKGRKFVTYAAVHSSATGGTLAQVTLPGLLYLGGYYAPSITGAANDRTFVVMETNRTSVGSIVWLFRLQLSASGRSIQVTRLPVHVPPTMAIDDIALSPDGSRLAMTAQWNCGQYRCQPQSFRGSEVWLPTVLISVFWSHVRLSLGRGVRGVPGVPGRAPAPTAPGLPPSVSLGWFVLVRWVLAVRRGAASR
jgi:hypothetical protein